LLLGTGPILGVAPSPEYTFLAYASPVGNYFNVSLVDSCRTSSSTEEGKKCTSFRDAKWGCYEVLILHKCRVPCTSLLKIRSIEQFLEELVALNLSLTIRL